jgi:hypothetical protein
MKDEDWPKRTRERALPRGEKTAAKALAANVMALVALAWLFDDSDEGSQS